MKETDVIEAPSWFVLRDLTRPNAKTPAYRLLAENGIKVFTPMATTLETRYGKRTKVTKPVIHDLLFARESKHRLDPLVEKTDTLQYRFVRGGKYQEAMTVRDVEMDRFIVAATGAENVRFYGPNEITEDKIGQDVRIIAGALQGLEGRILKVRGARNKHIIVRVTGIIDAVVTIESKYIEFID